ISKVLSGFQRDKNDKGFEIVTVKAWDYPALIEAYEKAEKIARQEHIPVLLHVQEVTQPQGHSTSGSHERYKSVERLEWEKEHDCNIKMRQWIIENSFATNEELTELEKEIKKEVREGKAAAWKAYTNEIKAEQAELLGILYDFTQSSSTIEKLYQNLAEDRTPIRKDILSTARKALRYATLEKIQGKTAISKWITYYIDKIQPKFSSHLYSENSTACD